MTTSAKPAPSAILDFFRSEAGGGVLLMLAAALAIIIANAGPTTAEVYRHLLHTPVSPALTEKLGPMTPHLWINDGLMALFFMLVGLEIKREWVDGRLADWDRRRLPFVAAAGGMVVPAVVYLMVTSGTPGLTRGWAIPAATDIAFALGVLALLGPRAPLSLKLFLTTVAIVDDMGAVAIIAIAYTASIKGGALLAALVILGAMFAMNKLGVKRLLPYLIGFGLLWYAILLSGVHATIAGVLAALTIPIRTTPGAPDAADSPLHILEHGLHPWSAYVIVPIFGFANAGVSLQGLGIDAIFSALPIGIALGLFLGKQIGIFGAVWISVRTGFAGKPRGTTWLQIYGISMLCGIGFTMSLFIGGLAFAGNALLVEEAKIGILMGSFASAVAGFCILRFCPLHPDHDKIAAEMAAEIASDGDVADVSDTDDQPARPVAQA